MPEVRYLFDPDNPSSGGGGSQLNGQSTSTYAIKELDVKYMEMLMAVSPQDQYDFFKKLAEHLKNAFKTDFATKEDIARLENKMATKDDIAALRRDLKLPPP